jgi:hypothetical protein
MASREAPQARRSRAPLLFSGLGVLLILMPVLFWHQTWFGRRLNDEEVGRYLQDDQHARRIQHALSQIADRIVNGETTVRRWYPQIAALAAHRSPIIRSTSAWAMGQDSSSELFHRALLHLLNDSDPNVRRNAALALVRFQDASGRPELVSMLLPYTLRAATGGTISIRSHTGQVVGSGALLALVRPQHGGAVEVRSPFPGRVEHVMQSEGAPVVAGDRLVALSPEMDQVWEALRGLYLVGQREDLADVEAYARGSQSVPERVRRQAFLAAAAIRTRAERNPSR